MSMSSNRPHDNDPLAPHRGRLLGLAYRMLGSRSDAEDVVQDAYLRFAGAQDVHNAEAFLVTVVTRLCLDRLKSAKAQREVYIGPWLPEPVFDAEGLSADAATELADDLSFALLLALDRLSPMERAAFLLHDVFDTPFTEIAAMLGRTEASCRQLASRARRAVRDNRPAPAATSRSSPNSCAQTRWRSPTAAAASSRRAIRSSAPTRSRASSLALPARSLARMSGSSRLLSMAPWAPCSIWTVNSISP
jgi:RNA polymerase sigma-70 factor (ECF subfamily)